MPNWKKVIVSGSNAVLNNITASGHFSALDSGVTIDSGTSAELLVEGQISASGLLHASLSFDATPVTDGVVVYDTAGGRLYYTGSYGGSSGGGTIVIKEDGVTTVAAATTIDFLNSIVTDGGSGEANVGFDLQGVTDSGAVTTNGSLFFHNQTYEYGLGQSLNAKSGFRVDSGKAYTHVTPQHSEKYIMMVGVATNNPPGLVGYPNNHLVYNKGVFFIGSQGTGGGTNDDDHPTDDGGLLIVEGKGINIIATSSVESPSTNNHRGLSLYPSSVFFFNSDTSASISGALQPASASAQIRFDTASNSVQFLAGSTNETLKEVLFISRSGDNPRIGIGTTNPLRAFDFKEIRDDSRGGELLIRGSRTTKGADVADEAGRINFAIDSSSFGNIETSGSTAEIVALVDQIDTSGVKGSLSFRVSTIKGEAPVEKLKITPTQIQATGSFVISGSNSFTNIGPATFSGSVAITDTLGVDGITTHNNNVVISNGLLDVNDSGVKIRGTAGLAIGTIIIPGEGQLRVNDFSMLLGGVHVGGTSDPGTDNLLVDGTSTLVGDTIISGSNLYLPNLATGNATTNYDKLLVVDSAGQTRTLAKSSVPFTEVFDGVTPTNQTLVMFSGSTGNTANATGISYNSATGWNFSNVGSAYDITVDDIIVLNDLTVTNGTFTDLTVNGTASISYLETLYETSSIIFSSGSTKFGDTMDDFHDFTGSVDITGSTNVVGNIITSGNISASGTITGNSIVGTIGTATQGTIDHDSLANFVANEHIDHSAVSVVAGTGLTGGGTIAANRTLNVIGGTGVTANANDIAIGQDVATTANVQFANITASGDISASGDLSALDLNLFGGGLSIKNQGAQSYARFYCESNNAHYTEVKAQPHSEFSGDPTMLLPAYDFDFASPDFGSADLAANNLSGTNTGDQDLSSYSTIVQLNASSSALQTNIDAKASITQLNASSSALQSNIDAKASITQLTATQSLLQTNIDAKVSNASTASFAITGSNVTFANITSSGNISASGTISANILGSSIYSETSTQSQFSIGNTVVTITDDDDTGANGIFRIAPGGVGSSADIEVARNSTADTVKLSVGSGLHIIRNGGGTPSFEVDNAGFIYKQDYNGDSITNSNPFNNGAGMGILNTNSGTPVICSLNIHGVFGAGNSAASTLHIGNPTGFASSTGTEEYNNGQNVFFKNNTLLEIAYGPASGSNDVDIIRYQASNTDSITDYRHGLQLSAVPNAGASTSSGRGQATNGSATIDMNAVDGYDVRSFVAPGQTIYIHEGQTTSLDTTKPNLAKFTVQSVDFTNETITLNSNWTGTSGDVSCWVEDTIVAIRNFDGDALFRFKGDGTISTTNINATSHITASGNISASGEIETNTVSTVSTVIGSDAATNVDTFATSTYNGAIYDYILKDSTVGARAGQFMVAHDDGDVTFTDTSTKHLSDSTIPEITADISGGSTVRVRVTNGNGYTFKAFVKKL